MRQRDESLLRADIMNLLKIRGEEEYEAVKKYEIIITQPCLQPRSHGFKRADSLLLPHLNNLG
jgi:hypothetical protein